jgi:hypothetical protein
VITEPFLRRTDAADALVEGFYLIQRRRAERVEIPVRIWWGPPVDPDTGEVLDRSPRWQIEIAGAAFDQPLSFSDMTLRAVTDFWPACAREPIDEVDYRYRVDRAAWSAEHDPNDALATPGGRIDPMTATLPGL